MRRLALLVGLVSLAAAGFGQDTDPKAIVHRALDVDSRNQEIRRNYTYIEREEQRTLDHSGAVKKRESSTWDITQLKGSQYRRLILRNDRPLTPKEERDQEAALAKRQARRDNLTPEERERRQRERARNREKERREMNEALDGFDLRLAGEEEIDGVPVWVVEGTPRRDFKPKSRDAAFLTKIKGRIWVAKTDYQPVKIDAETIDTISIGGILARIYKGTRIHVEYTRVNGEVWLPKRMSFAASARVMLVKGFHIDSDSTFSNYRKFTADSKVITEQ